MQRVLLSVCLSLVAGCAGQNSQLTSCQAEKEQLLTTIRAQRDTARAVSEEVASLESRLDQAEKELARAGGGTRLSSRPAETRPAAQPPAIKSESLPWRAPAAKETTAPLSPALPHRANATKSTLIELARRERSLNYDATAGAARIALPLEFRSGGAQLSAADKSRLDDVSKILRAEGARELPIVIASQNPKQAQAVADYLDRHGVSDDRLLVTSGAHWGGRTASEEVSIYLAGDDSPILAEARTQATRR